MINWKNALGNATKIALSASLASAFCIAVPAGAIAADEAPTASQETQDSDDVLQEDAAVQSDYTNQYFADLLAAGQLSAGANVKLETSDSYEGVLVSGTASELSGQGIAVSREFDFSDGAVSRVRVQAMTQRKTKATLSCYLDGSTTPLASFALKPQKKSSSWDMGTQDYCLDISKLNLTGRHKVTFKIIGSNVEAPKVLLKSFEFMKFTVPVVNFNIDESLGTVDAMNGSGDHSAECYGSIDINVPLGYTSEYTGETLQSASYDLDYVRGRGNSTWVADTGHKPYKVKLEKSSDLLGMGKNKHWVLVANYYDNSQLRNKISYWLSEQLGFEYTVKLEPVEVVMNGEYYGSYYLCEQVRVGKNRVAIDDLEDSKDATDEATISGGYLLNLGESSDSNQYFETSAKDTSVQWTIESPKFEDYFNQAQYDYIRNYVTATQDALYASDFKGKSGKSYTEYLDLDSAVNFLWMQEFSRNGDAYVGGSNYLYKKRGGKLYFGPVWDFDYVAWGSTEYDKLKTTGWSQKYGMWVARLLQDKQFTALYVERWQTLKAALEQLTQEGGKLDQYANRIQTAVSYNTEKWGVSPLWDTGTEEDAGESGSQRKTPTFKEEVERLRTWITQRSAWVDANISNVANPTKCTITLKQDGKVLRKQAAYVGEIFSLEGNQPTKKGYSFEGWKTSYKLSYKDYLKVRGISEEELIDEVGAKKAAQIKKNGYSYSGMVDEWTFNIPGNITLNAVFTPMTDGLAGSTFTRNNVNYEVTGTSSSTGRNVRVMGLANTKAKKATIAKSIKIKGKRYAVTEICAKAFNGCKKLVTLKIKAPGAYVRSSTFAKLNKKLVIKVAAKGLSHYQTLIHGRRVQSL